MNVIWKSSRLVKPIYKGDPPSSTQCTPLSVFDRFTSNAYIPLLYAYKPPNPSNALLEQGLRHVLSEYRQWAGRFDTDEKGRLIILLNDEGVRFFEASADYTFDQAFPFTKSTLQSLNPSSKGVKELLLIQLTRFTCGSLVIGLTCQHKVTDGYAMSQFMVAWGQACRGLEISLHPFHDRTIFTTRDPPQFKFEHRGVEFTTKHDQELIPSKPSLVDDMVFHTIHFTSEFVVEVQQKASSACQIRKPFSKFVSLIAHLWRAIARARELNELETTYVRISVSGRARLNPCVPNEYFGNVVLWAFPTTKVKDLLQEPLSYAAKLIQEAVAKVNDDYFKSFIDFASYKVEEEDLIKKDYAKSDLSPTLDVDSWLGFQFNDLDFGHVCNKEMMEEHILKGSLQDHGEPAVIFKDDDEGVVERITFHRFDGFNFWIFESRQLVLGPETKLDNEHEFEPI